MIPELQSIWSSDLPDGHSIEIVDRKAKEAHPGVWLIQYTIKVVPGGVKREPVDSARDLLDNHSTI